VTGAPPDPPPPSRTKWTRRVPHPVLIGHAASLSQVKLRGFRIEVPPPPLLVLTGQVSSLASY
jgi:hypothetical protein